MDTPAQAPTEAAALYIGYVENRHSGDARVDGLILAPVDGLILAPEEAAWLQACSSVPLRRHGHEELGLLPRADRAEEPRQVAGVTR
jgi:hypothetical protein